MNLVFAELVRDQGILFNLKALFFALIVKAELDTLLKITRADVLYVVD